MIKISSSPIKETFLTLSSSPSSRKIQENSIRSLQQSAKSSSPLKTLSHFFEGLINFFKFFCCCGCKTITPNPFKIKNQDIKLTTQDEVLFYEAAAKKSFPWMKNDSFATILSPIIHACNILDENIEKGENQEIAFIKVGNKETELTTTLTYTSSIMPKERAKNRQTIIESSLQVLEQSKKEDPDWGPFYSFATDVAILRVTGNRVDTFTETTYRTPSTFTDDSHASTSLAWTKDGARKEFVRQLGKQVGKSLQLEDFYDDDGKYRFTIKAPPQSLLNPSATKALTS